MLKPTVPILWDTKPLSSKVERCLKCDMKWARLPGATMISCFLDLILRKVRSFWGSMSRTVLLAFMVSWWRRPAYWTVVELSKVVRMGMPSTRFNYGLNIFFFSFYKSNRCIIEILENTGNFKKEEKVMTHITHWNNFTLFPSNLSASTWILKFSWIKL